MKYAAGIWDQITEESDGEGLVAWSSHSREDLAIRAARKYARESSAATGGALTWCGGVRGPDGAVTWYRADGSVAHQSARS